MNTFVKLVYIASGKCIRVTARVGETHRLRPESPTSGLLEDVHLEKATITRCHFSPDFICIDVTLLCEFESDKI